MPRDVLPDSLNRQLADRIFSRAAGVPLVEGNQVELLIDAQAHFDRWLDAIRQAHDRIFLENYLVSDDAVGREFRDALVERALAGVKVYVIHDWLGCLWQSRQAFWNPLVAAGGKVRVYGAPRPLRPLTFISRDHRKMLAVDDTIGFLSGVCISSQWLGNPARNLPPWRDTGVALRGPILAHLQHAFADSWAHLGGPLEEPLAEDAGMARAGNTALRLIATRPSTTGVYRLDHMIAAMARKTLWITDAYFVGVAPYLRALASAAGDGVDVRLLVPGASNIPLVAMMSRTGYRPLLESGVRVFEWNGSMLHAKTAVADARWARIGSSNLNIASWLGNQELDVAIEDVAFGQQMQAQYEKDLANATEIVLSPRVHWRGHRIRGEHENDHEHKDLEWHQGRGSSSRAAASAMRLAHTVGASLTDRRTLAEAEATPIAVAALVLIIIAVLGFLWPRVLGWPLAAIVLWLGMGLATHGITLRRRKARRRRRGKDA